MGKTTKVAAMVNVLPQRISLNKKQGIRYNESCSLTNYKLHLALTTSLAFEGRASDEQTKICWEVERQRRKLSLSLSPPALSSVFAQWMRLSQLIVCADICSVTECMV